MKYCSDCGQLLAFRVPPGDNLQRHLCDSCGKIHYENPRMVVGCVPVWKETILLCRRAIEPRYGYWTAPAGFMENGESADEGAIRETREEACASVEIRRLHTIYSIPHINQVHLFFLADLISPTFSPGSESLETKLFRQDEIPWDDLAFTSVRFALEKYFEDRTGPAHMGAYYKQSDD